MDNKGGDEEEWSIKIFRRNFLTVPKSFVGEPFCAVIQKFSVSEKIYI